MRCVETCFYRALQAETPIIQSLSSRNASLIARDKTTAKSSTPPLEPEAIPVFAHHQAELSGLPACPGRHMRRSDAKSQRQNDNCRFTQHVQISEHLRGRRISGV